MVNYNLPGNTYDPRLGWRKSRYDRRDFLHPTNLAIPNSSSLLKYKPITRDQGDEGSCTGHGIGANLTAIMIKLGIFIEWVSVRDIYNGGRFTGGYMNEEGAYPDDCLKWLLQKGVLLESLWRYAANGTDKNKVPPGSLDPERAKRPIISYTRVVNDIEGICSAIASGHPVSLGSPWFDKWMNAPKGKLATVTSKDYVAGGHETCLFAYDKTTKIFTGLNSWGTVWGDNGLYYMPFSAIAVFKSVEGYDAHIIDVKWGTAPVPPEPTPVPVSQKVIIEGTLRVL